MQTYREVFRLIQLTGRNLYVGKQEKMAKNIFLKYVLFLSLIVLHLKCSRNRHMINVNAATPIPMLSHN